MALDSKITQNINLRANGDALLRPLQAMGNQLNRLVAQMQQLANPSTAKGRAELEKLTLQANKALGTIRTLNDLMESGSRSGRGKATLFSGLDEQALGRKVLSASKLKTELEKTTKASEALEVRLTQLYKKFNDLGNAGKAIGQRDIAKALNTQEAIRQVQQIEKELARLDGRNAARGGTLPPELVAMRGQISTASSLLLSKVQNGRRADWTKEIAELGVLADSYKNLTRGIEASATAAQRAASQRRASIMDTINMNEAQLRSSLNRGASQFSFTPDQARQLNLPLLNAQIEQGTSRLQAYQLAMSRAVAQGKSTEVIDRLALGFQRLSARISESIAQKKAFDALPEQRMKSLTNALFADGGMAFAGRIAGASIITTGIFAAINAAQQGVQNIVQLEDAFAKLQAISGSTDTQMQKFAGTLLKLSENSRYSALEIAEGATQLAQAGYGASEAAGVLEASLNLAAGSGSTVSEAIDTMTSSLGAFQLQASDAGHVADVLMEGLNQSKLSIQQMQSALQYAGATAHEAGIGLEELTAITASLANAGIKSGSTIGTGIRQLLVDLQTPTDKFKLELKSLGLTMADVDVRAKGLAEVVRTLSAAGFSAEAAYNGFEVRAAAAFLAFRNQIDVYDELAAQLTKTGAASEAAAKANESLAAKWQKTKNSLTELVEILAGPFINALKMVLDLVGGVVSGFVSLLTGLSDLVGGSQSLSIALTALLPVIGACFGPAGAIIGGVAALLSLAGAANRSADELDKLQAATDEASEKMNANRQTVTSVDEAINGLIQRQDQLKNNHVALQVETLNLTEKFDGLVSILGGAANGYDDLLAAMLRYRGVAMRELQEGARGQFLAARDQVGPLANQFYRGNLDLQKFFPLVGGKNVNRTPQINAAIDYAKRASTTPFENLNSDQLIDERLKLEKIINDLTAAKQTTGVYKAFYDELKEQLATLQQIAGARAKMTTAENQYNVASAALSPQETKRYDTFTKVQSDVQQGLEANKDKQGSGDAILRATMATAKREVASIEAQLKGMDRNSAQAKVLMDDLARIRGEIAKVQRASDEATRDLMKNEKAGAGEDLQGSAVAALIRSEFKGANVYSYGKRPYSTQVRLYNDYIHGRGPRAAKPGTSSHGSGHAVDITPIPGVTLDQVVAFLESRGVEVYQPQAEQDPRTKRWHWHIAWKPKKSHAQTEIDNDLQKLLETRADKETSTLDKHLQTILSQAKGGQGTFESLYADAKKTSDAYVAAGLHAFDVAHPITEGTTNVQLQARADARKAVQEKLLEDVKKYYADFMRAVSDNAVHDAELAYKESKRVLDEALRKAEQISKDAQHQIDVAGNRRNQFTVGAGDSYLLDRNKERADDQADQASILAHRQHIYADMLTTSNLEASINKLPEGDDKASKLEKVAEAWAKIREELAQVADLQGQVNARHEEFIAKPLKERIEGAAQAWLENSGAMDSWQKQAQNAVGPALDTLTDGFSQFFTDVVSGSKGFKAALGDMLKTFAMFVIQMIAKALALAAVKAILKAMGLSMPGSYNGGPVQAPTAAQGGTGQFNGGPIIPGRYSGGAANDNLYGGGDVRRGVSNRDSALYNLAHGEYVIRNKSVREIGMANMELINKHGAKGLAKLQGANVMQNIMVPKQETNVFVVKPDSAPPMGPNDVLVTVHEDILQGGTTKKLIKHVSNGG